MKKILLILGFSLALNTIANASTNEFAWSPPLETNELLAERFSPLPLQAGVCDIVGIGVVTNSTVNSISLTVENFWIGNPGSNTLTISTDNAIPPVTNTPIVFFATKYSSFLSLEPWQSRFTYIFDMEYHRQRFQPDGLYLYDSGLSWFPATAANAELVSFASNLVHAAQMTTNKMEFYTIIRDGFRLYPETSRIHRDSETLFDYCSYWGGTNFMKQIWSDTLLPMRLRGTLQTSYRLQTDDTLPWPLP